MGAMVRKGGARPVRRSKGRVVRRLAAGLAIVVASLELAVRVIQAVRSLGLL